MTVWAVVVAAGAGSRFGGPKQFAEIGGRRSSTGRSTRPARWPTGSCSWSPPTSPAPRRPAPDGADVVVAGGATRAGIGARRARRRPRRRRGDRGPRRGPPAGLGGAVPVRGRRRRRPGRRPPFPALALSDTVKRVDDDGGRGGDGGPSRALVTVQTPAGVSGRRAAPGPRGGW